ncbi:MULTISPECIES: Uma2 family endonuclease [Micromonospora]|uniref:Uma2 family endonuclease n=1 Tax=Micromonospora solifontis TaxID=2487138 RepID=A0ABX9WIM9_9ACTN|nr:MULTISPECIES: Uma2 family endonuclease [Micromonospora]NES15333.1 Uma2 family endonuclease [Micromonospora sp. PPF5-17B]NES36124.1 Uma2 family endonuclease [Micromonospora solifontis]NES56681.1 Uma2 family endonuclease [Micromonospora sp. PPF5-6]RNL99923.1 Uma2 family endonuclease [Micromonospora solifontis]
MTAAVFGHDGPWTEEEYLALGETQQRVELFDGSLHVTPAPTPRHQRISRKLGNVLEAAAEAVRLELLEAVNVRLRPGRVPIPDLVITEQVDLDELIIEADAVRLVCEIISPSNAATDKVLKMHYYAAAGIEWYLLVEQETLTMHLYQRQGAHYVERSVTKAGAALELTEPVRATIRPEELLG